MSHRSGVAATKIFSVGGTLAIARFEAILTGTTGTNPGTLSISRAFSVSVTNTQSDKLSNIEIINRPGDWNTPEIL